MFDKRERESRQTNRQNGEGDQTDRQSNHIDR